MKDRVAAFEAIVSVVLWLSCSAFCQVASIQGTVFDPDHSVVPQAKVKLQCPGESPIELLTDAHGIFTSGTISTGTYTLSIQKEGFAIYQKEKVRISSGAQVKLTIVLSLPVYQEAVTATNSEDATGSSLQENEISAQELRQMSDNPDAFRDELQTMVGPDALYRLNGIEIDVKNLPSKELIQSIRIATGTFSAEYPNTWHWMVDIFTDPSQITFGGSVMGMGTTTALSAQNPFAPEKTPYDQIFGRASLHGHLGKRLSYGWTLSRSYNDTGSIINAQILNSSFEQVNFRNAASSGSHGFGFELTPSIYISKNDNVVGYFNIWVNTANNQGVGDLNLVEHSYVQRQVSQSDQFTYNHSFAANINNEFQFSYRNGTEKQRPSSIEPEVLVTGAFTGGGNSIGNTSLNTYNYTMKDVLRAVTHKHMLAIGAEAHGYESDSRINNNFNGTFTFPSLSTYQITMEGIAVGLSASEIRAAGGGASQFQITTGKDTVSACEPDIAGFVQDNIDVLPNVGVSYGLRVESQKTLDGVNFAPRLSVIWGIDGSAKKPARTSLQASLGIFYERFSLDSITGIRRYQSNKTSQYTYMNPDFFPEVPQTLQGQEDLSSIPSSYGFSNRLQASYMTRENVSLMRKIGKQSRFAILFFHSLGQRQYDERNVNAPLPGTYNPDEPQSGIRPTGKLENIFQYESEGMNKGSEIMVQYMGSIKKHISVGGLVGANFAKGDVFGSPSNPYSLKDDYGRSTPEQPYGSFWGAIEIPKIVTIHPWLNFRPGTPLNITLGEDLNGDTIYNDRPAFATNLESSTVIRTKYGDFETNPGATEKRIPVNLANGPMVVMLNMSASHEIPLHFMEQPGKKWKPAIAISADGENILNHPNLSTPQGSLNSPLFGKSISTAAPMRDFHFNVSFRF